MPPEFLTDPGGVRGQTEENSDLHGERLEAVVERIRASGAESVIDLGCGAGALLERLVAETAIRRVVGLDASARALRVAAERIGCVDGEGERVRLECRSFLEPLSDLGRFDAAAMVECIEHVDPLRLSAVESAVFSALAPAVVVMTTPNREYNSIYGLGPGDLRHADHRFEWTRAKFRTWAEGVARRNDYNVSISGIGMPDAMLGSPTQMAVFVRSTRADVRPGAAVPTPSGRGKRLRGEAHPISQPDDPIRHEPRQTGANRSFR